MFALVWLLCKWLKNDLITIGISCVFWLIGYVCGALFPNIFCIWTAFNYLPFFILGMKLREKKDGLLYRIPIRVIVFIQLILFCVYQMTSNLTGIIIFKLINLISLYGAHVFGALMSFFVLQYFASKVEWKKNKVFMLLSKNSMTIYLFHQQIIYFTILWLNGKVNPYVNSFINFVVSLFLSSLISTMLMKFKVTRILIGEKN